MLMDFQMLYYPSLSTTFWNSETSLHPPTNKNKNKNPPEREYSSLSQSL